MFSVTLGGWANSFVLTCWRRMSGAGMFVAGGNELGAEVELRDARVGWLTTGAVLSLKRRA